MWDDVRDWNILAPHAAINHFTHDTDAEIELLRKRVAALGAKVVVAKHWAEGGAGAMDLAAAVLALVDGVTSQHRYVYESSDSLWDKISAVATKVYGAASISAPAKVRDQIKDLGSRYPEFPVCMAKTQMSFSTDPSLRGAPSGHTVEISEVRVSAGAGFIVASAGHMMTIEFESGIF